MKNTRYAKNFLILTVLFVLFPLRDSFPDSAFTSEIDYAERFIQDGFFDMAESRLVELLLSDISMRDAARIYLLLGKIYHETGQPRKALAEFAMVAERFRNTEFESPALFWMGEVHYGQGRYKRALAKYQNVLFSDPSGRFTQHALYGIAWCYEGMDDLNAAADVFRYLIEKHPDKDLAVSAGYFLGDVLFRSGRYGEAVGVLRSHISRYPVSASIFESYYLLGECYYALGDLYSAESSFKSSVRAPGHREWKSVARYRIGEIKHSFGLQEEAMEWFKEVSEEARDPELRAAALLAIAAIASEAGDPAVIVSSYSSIIRDVPRNKWTREGFFLLGEYHRSSGDLENAVAVYREALLRYPSGEVSSKIRYALAESYRGLGEDTAALDEFYYLAENAGTDRLVVDALMSAADILKRAEDVETAFELYDRVLREFPDDPMSAQAQYEIGGMMADAGRKNSAILAFQSLVVNFPDFEHLDKVYYRLGSLYSLRGDNYSALESFEKLIEDFPESDLVPEAYVQKADTLYRMGRYADVLVSCENILRWSESAGMGYEGPRERIARYFSGWANYRLGREEEAYRIFTDLMDAEEDALTPGIIFWFGEYFYGKGEFSSAREYFTKTLERFPESHFARDAEYWTGWVLYEDNRFEDSIRQFRKIVSSFPDGKWSPQAALTIGDILKKTGDVEGALEQYHEVVEIYRGTGIASIASNRMGTIFKIRGQYPLAVEYFRTALTSSNTETNAQIQFDIAESYERSGDIARALQEYLRVEYRYPAGEFWVMRARLRSAEIFESKGQLQNAYRMYEKLAQGPGADAEHARKKMELLRRQFR